MAFCAACGTQMPDNANACPKCGKAVAQSVGSGAAAAPAPAASSGMSENLTAALSYLWITAIIFLLIEPYKNQKFVRFHSFQSLFLGIASFGIHIVLSLIPIIGWILLPFASLGIFIIAVIAAVKAYQNQEFKLPVIGEMAAKQAGA